MSDENKPETLAELFSRDPFSYSKQDIDRIITHYRESRRTFTLTEKGIKEKQTVDLKDLGIL